jgi:SAM-dependent methyltransferase
VLHDPDGANARWSVVVAPGVDPVPERNQAIVQSVAELVPASQAPAVQFVPANLGNPYPPRFAELLASANPDAVVIDVGGGDRCHEDPRVFNFEYMKFRHADFFGDGLELPIASNSVDLIMSQAVLEHVPDPKRAVAELRRILRPGGRIYAEFAFMQPLHAVPFHFFNITPHGADLLFADWEILATGTFGGLETTMEWFFRLLDAERKLGPEQVGSVLRSLHDLDVQLSARELDYVASAVYVEAIKPL